MCFCSRYLLAKLGREDRIFCLKASRKINIYTFVIQSNNVYYNCTCGVLYIHEGWLRCVQGTKNENTKIKDITTLIASSSASYIESKEAKVAKICYI